ncbi:MAG: TetR/AcrR family transcriptional regulator [Anaerolineae bacterium]
MSPRTKLANQQIRDDRREQILTAARIVFASKGYGATVIDDIAAAAGISKGLIYHYFPGKEDLFVALVQRTMQGALALMEEAASRLDSAWARLFWLTSEVMARAKESPDEFAIILQAYTSQAVPQTARDLAVEYTTASVAAVRDLIIQGQSSGHIVAGDSDQLAVTFTACLQGLALTVSVSGRQEGTHLPDAQTALRMIAINPGPIDSP